MAPCGVAEIARRGAPEVSGAVAPAVHPRTRTGAHGADQALRSDRPAQQNAPHIEKRGRGRPFDVRRVRRARRDEFSRLIQCA
ncbi:hypothetical protein AW168_12010 [Nocardia brasiliensis]|uniref:Uncharacterized protein n=1 Tax=Nocardia brasiliensis (strain ATCC 700358 / HUJEG-1) TaxID=1133849 RepID=K0F8I1_NOCB7|nr:hypothetical protein O3I_038640 [Nocardia brasiliensis ATCC 700358]OCF89875.1 hypothetical protein AW168_12010 [Nocardia brasiliensis]